MSSQQRQAQQGGGNPIAVERSEWAEHGILTAPSPRDIEIVERRVENVAARLAVQNVSDIDNLSEVAIRDLIPQLDLESGADNSALENRWLQDTLTADALNETYTIDHDARAQDKVIVVFAISNVAASPATTEVRVENNQGGVFEILQVQGLLTDEEVLGLLNDPIISATSNQNFAFEQFVTATSDELVFHGKVAEEAGTEIAENPRNFLSGLAPRSGGGGRGR